MTDWRGPDDADAQEARSPYDPDYLKKRTADGEAYAWYYPDDQARADGRRVEITDGLGSPWINRPKDLRNWWSNAHVERRGGALSNQTAWVPQSKPIWFTEIGCPAVDCGGNAPNLFPDPRSSENGRPPFSRGLRDDLMLARMLEGAYNFWEDAHNNPVSTRTGNAMVDITRIHVWAWDARPYPSFPTMASVWGDASNWYTGHWLNGRLEHVSLDCLTQTILTDIGLSPERPAIDATLDGFSIAGLSSPREALDGLLDLFGIDCVASSGELRFVAGDENPVAMLTVDDLVPDRDGKVITIRRAQDSDLPREVKLTFLNSQEDYKLASVYSRRVEGITQRKALSETSLVLWRGAAQRVADQWLERRWTMRETAEARLRPGLIHLEAGDVISIDAGFGGRLWQITRVNDQVERAVELRSVRRAVDRIAGAPPVIVTSTPPEMAGPPALIVTSLPIVLSDPAPLLVAAAFAKPWPGLYEVRRGRAGYDEESAATIEAPATIGRITSIVAAGPLWRFDRVNSLDVTLSGGALVSVGEEGALAGSALAAIGSDEAGWEVIAYAKADLIGERRYRVSGLLRGLGSSEGMAQRRLEPGSTFIALDGALTPLTTDPQDIGVLSTWRVGSDETAQESARAANASALKPLAPVHPRIIRGSAGCTISFIRRTRFGGDGWDVPDISLSEEFERYRITIMKQAGAPVRTLEVSETSVLYRTEDELKDFGIAQTQFDLSIVQLSRLAGEGHRCEATCLVA